MSTLVMHFGFKKIAISLKNRDLKSFFAFFMIKFKCDAKKRERAVFGKPR